MADELQHPAEQALSDKVADIAAHVTRVERTAEMLSMTALAAARVIEVQVNDVPRLLVAASCRTLETLIENYSRRQELAGAGKIAWDLVDRGRRRQEILSSAQDLMAALTDGIETAERIIHSLEPGAPEVGESERKE